MKTDTLIVGGGISGLHTAYQLQKLKKDFLLVEARDRLGGRILSKNYRPSASDNNKKNDYAYGIDNPAFDLGPSWFWPGQYNINGLIKELGIEDSVFSQQGTGKAVYEDQQGNIQKGFYGISMEGAYRVNGGMQQIIQHLEQHITNSKIYKSSHVTSIEYTNDKIITTVLITDDETETEQSIESNKVVIALPPRIAMSSITFKPALAESRVNELNSYATWMAGHAKAVISYEKPFWLEQHLSGDAVSHLGPLREIHDASSDPNHLDDNKGFALFGFVGIPSSYRSGKEDEIISAVIDQLVRLFGKDAAKPIQINFQDWAEEKYTATEIDRTVSAGHATTSITELTESGFGDSLIWSGTETADYRRGHNGLIEGALEASESAIELLA